MIYVCVMCVCVYLNLNAREYEKQEKRLKMKSLRARKLLYAAAARGSSAGASFNLCRIHTWSRIIIIIINIIVYSRRSRV